MPDGQVLHFAGLTKRFGAVSAVDDLTARVEPGLVTGFLGPNGAGKTTSLRMLLGLVRPTSGTATIGGRGYHELDTPLQSVGAALEASSFHPGRSAANHLAVYAQAAGIPRRRIDEVLGLVGLADVAGRRIGGFSLGMRQRLGLATALLGDPGVLVLDEPSNGLDPEGIRWMRSLLRTLAEEGRTVLVSSHLLAEVQQTVDALLIISRGRLVFQGGIEDLADPDEYATIVDAPDREALQRLLDAEGIGYQVLRNGLTVRHAEPVALGALAAGAGIALSSLQRKGASLEEIFLELVSGARVHASAGHPPVVSVDAVAPEPSATASAVEPAAVAPAEPSTAGAPASTSPEPNAAEAAASRLPASTSVDPGTAHSEASGVVDAAHAAPDASQRVQIPDAAAAEPSPSTGLVHVVPTARPARTESTDAPRSARSYAVASTGVIDIVPRDDGTTENAETEGQR